MTEAARELNKLLDELIKLAWKISSLAGVILFLLHSLRYGTGAKAPVPYLKYNINPPTMQA